MGWRSVVISQPAYLSLSNRRLHIEQAENATSVPLEDISALILDNPQLMLTVPLLSELANNGIVVLTVDGQHLPNGVFLPFLSYHRGLQRLRAQLRLGKPRAKQWQQQIVRQKILNQSQTLSALGRRRPVSALNRLAVLVRSGDPDNYEARAAALYFRSLFGSPLYRGQIRFYNAALNYGYAVVRAAIARSLVATGIHPSLGLFHNNEQNAFNLVDDLIEPYRPLLDLWVSRLFPDEPERELEPIDKGRLVSFLHQDVGNSHNDELSTVLVHIEKMCQGFARACEEGKSTKLWLACHAPDYFIREEVARE